MRQMVRGLPTLRQATFRTLRRPEVQRRLWAASDSGSISFVSYFSFAGKRLEPQRFIAIWSHRRVGAHLAVGTPPGTVRAPLDAYGSTSETAERHIFQRGHFPFRFELGQKCGLSPLEDQTQIVPVLVATGLFGNNSMKNDF